MRFLNKRFGQVACIVLGYIMGIHVVMSTILFGGFETKLIYYPINRDIRNIWVDLDKTIQDTYFYSRDGIKLNAWYVKAKKGKPTVLYCHGQGENISLWQNVMKFLVDKGYGVFLLDYRGHGHSEGKPFESGLYIDLESSINYLETYEKVPKKDIILWGRSLGSAVVADIASRDDFKGVILESPFTNIREEALHLTENGILENKFGFWSFLSGFIVEIMPITQKFATDQKIHKIDSPLLLGHSINDTTVPAEMSYSLKLLNDRARFFVSDNGSHHESEWFFEEVADFIKSLDKPAVQDNVTKLGQPENKSA